MYRNFQVEIGALMLKINKRSDGLSLFDIVFKYLMIYRVVMYM